MGNTQEAKNKEPKSMFVVLLGAEVAIIYFGLIIRRRDCTIISNIK